MCSKDTTPRVWFGGAQAQEGSSSSRESPLEVKDLEVTQDKLVKFNTQQSRIMCRNEENPKANRHSAKKFEHLFLEIINHIPNKVVSVSCRTINHFYISDSSSLTGLIIHNTITRLGLSMFTWSNNANADAILPLRTDE